jgi:hypothetical protein
MQWTLVAVVAAIVVVPGALFIWLMADREAQARLGRAIRVAHERWSGGSRARAANLRDRLKGGLDHVYSVTSSEISHWRRFRQHVGDRPRSHWVSRGDQVSEAARRRYADRWMEAQTRFLEDPTAALSQAERLVGDVMRDCARRSRQEIGREQVLAMLHETHPGRPQSLEQQREMMLLCRSVIQELLSEEGAEGAGLAERSLNRAE